MFTLYKKKIQCTFRPKLPFIMKSTTEAAEFGIWRAKTRNYLSNSYYQLRQQAHIFIRLQSWGGHKKVG
jgi:hypothetical protein